MLVTRVRLPACAFVLSFARVIPSLVDGANPA